MKKMVSLSLLLLVLGALVALMPPSANAQSAGLVSSVLNRMEKNRQNLKSLRAGISMEKYNAQLRDAEAYQGTVVYMPAAGRNASVRIEWRKPQNEILAVSNGKYTLFRPRLNMAYVGSAKSQKVDKSSGGLLDLLYMSRKDLESRFQPLKDVREETLWGGVSTIHLTLVPQGNASFKYAEIWVDSAGMPVQTKIVEKNGDATTMRLTGLEKNVKVSSEEFVVRLDPSVKVVKG
jgi:outer membrane lipoprotein-sorting protein